MKRPQIWRPELLIINLSIQPTLIFTFPRGAARGGDLACCVAGRGKYGLPAFSSVLPSAGAARRQSRQACVPTRSERENKWKR